jgi:hypothetical protein
LTIVDDRLHSWGFLAPYLLGLCVRCSPAGFRQPLLRYAVHGCDQSRTLRLHEADRSSLRRPPFTPPSGSATPGKCNFLAVTGFPFEVHHLSQTGRDPPYPPRTLPPASRSELRPSGRCHRVCPTG